jgi:hypothetical protein
MRHIFRAFNNSDHIYYDTVMALDASYLSLYSQNSDKFNYYKTLLA